MKKHIIKKCFPKELKLLILTPVHCTPPPTVNISLVFQKYILRDIMALWVGHVQI